MKLRFRPAALADLEDIYDYIAADNPVGAGKFRK
jgi:plasmid stabilization system protein ParE